MRLPEIDIPTGEIEREPVRSSDLAFFIPGLIDEANLNALRMLIVGQSTAIRNGKDVTSPAKVEELSSSLELSMAAFKETIECETAGTLILASPVEPTAPENNRKALYNDYGTGEPIPGSEHRALVIPVMNITAITATADAVTAGKPRPSFNVRVRTSIDKPTSYFAGPGQRAERPSEGSWFTFQFEDTQVALQGSTSETTAAGS